MFRFLFRALIALLMFALRNSLGGGSRRETGSTGPAGPRSRAPRPRIDRSDVVDVPFTEIPPPSGPAPGPATGS